MECLLPYACMATLPHIMVGLERMLDYRGVGLARFHCIHECMDLHMYVCCIICEISVFACIRTYVYYVQYLFAFG